MKLNKYQYWSGFFVAVLVIGFFVTIFVDSVIAQSVATSSASVVVGDSIAEGYPNWRAEINAGFKTAYISPVPGGVPEYQISYWLNKINGKVWINSGRASDTALLVKNRLDAHVLTYIRESKGTVVLYVGVNDIGLKRSYNEYQKDLTDILNRVRDAGGTLVIVDIGPGNSLTVGESTRVTDWNKWLKKWAKEERVTLISHYDHFGLFRTTGVDGNLWNLQSLYSYDGLHLSIIGVQKLAETIDGGMKSSIYNTACSKNGGRCGTFKGTTADGYVCAGRMAEFDTSCPGGGMNPYPYCFTSCVTQNSTNEVTTTCIQAGGTCGTFMSTTVDGKVCSKRWSEYDSTCPKGGMNPHPYCFGECLPAVSSTPTPQVTCGSVGGKCVNVNRISEDNYTCNTSKQEYNSDCPAGGINPYPYCFTDCRPN